MAGHSRSKNGVLSHAYVPAIHVFRADSPQVVGGRGKRGHDGKNSRTYHTLFTPSPYSISGKYRRTGRRSAYPELRSSATVPQGSVPASCRWSTGRLPPWRKAARGCAE